MALTKAHPRIIEGAAISVKDFGAVGDGVTDDTAAIQAVFDSIPQYSTTTQNSGARQTPVEISFPEGVYIVSEPIVKEYRNYMNIVGPGSLKASSTFSGGDYLLSLIACSHCTISGMSFDGNNYSATSALRLSGDGFTGAKRNSTNLLVDDCFFFQFGAEGSTKYVLDTLSPNNTPGDYSIDDSIVQNCVFLGAYSGGIRLASSEIRLKNLKFSFIGIDGNLPVINLGNGSSGMFQDIIFTSSNTTLIKADNNASIGRVQLSGCYIESTENPFYEQSGGTVRSLSITDGYYAALDDSDADFISFTGGCRGQVTMTGNTFQSNGYTKIQLGTSGSLFGDLQTSSTSFKSFVPYVVGGTFSATAFGMQPSQSGMTDKKRQFNIIHDVFNATKAEIFVDTTLPYDQPYILKFASFQNALKYIDQAGYTLCRIVDNVGSAHTIDEDITICGDVEITGTGGTSYNVTGSITVKNGARLRWGGVTSYGDNAFINQGGELRFFFAALTGNGAGDYLVDHQGGTTVFQNSSSNTRGNLCDIDNSLSSGTIRIQTHTFNFNAVVTDADPNSVLVEFIDSAPPSTGSWKVGSRVKNKSPSAGGNIGWVCVAAGAPGTWKSFGSIAS